MTMGRHLKRGLDYFNIDCVQEDSLNYLEAKHGISGYGVLVKLWRKIYMVEGYFCEWSEKNIYLFSKEVGVGIEEIKAIVETCFSEGIFQEEMYKNYGVLTSRGVQKRWVKIVTEAKRKECTIDPKLMITEKTLEEIGFTPEEITKTPEESTQRKVKESKEEESKEKESGAPVAPPVPKEKRRRENFVAPSFQELRDRFTTLKGNTASPGCWAADRIHNEAQKMMAHYTANGWIQGKGKPIVDWKAACVTWISNAMEGTFSATPRREAPAPKASAPVMHPGLPKIEVELNYLFGRYREGECTVISIDPLHYNHLKNTGKLSFSPDKVDVIRQLAVEKLRETRQPETEASITPMMKKVGVIEFFKDLQTTGAEAVFQ